MKEIFFCENNISKGLEDIIERIENEHPDVYTYIEPCLGRCRDCIEVLYCVIDADMITGDTPEKLYENIKVRLEEL